MAHDPYKIKFFIGTPSEVEREFNDWMAAGGDYLFSNVNMAGTADKIVVRLVYYKQGIGNYY